MVDLLDSILVSGQSEVYMYGGDENAPYILTNIDVASQTNWTDVCHTCGIRGNLKSDASRMVD